MIRRSHFTRCMRLYRCLFILFEVINRSFKVWCFWARLIRWYTSLPLACQSRLILWWTYSWGLNLMIYLIYNWQVLWVWSCIKSPWEIITKGSKLEWTKFSLCSRCLSYCLKLLMHLVVVTHVFKMVILFIVSNSSSDLFQILKWYALIHLKMTCFWWLLVLFLRVWSTIKTW